MKYAKIATLLVALSVLGGCAGLDFGEKGLSYYEPKPYMLVTVNSNCDATGTLVSLPGEKKFVKFKSGYGSADLSVALSNGILTNVNQKTDTQIPETITSIASLATAAKLKPSSIDENLGGTKKTPCSASARLYEIVDGKAAEEYSNNFQVDINK